ncbi:MAG: TolC family protein, partial [Spirochaetaceae bacterium]|nr:TolC family protein [Spirochaetaceae bacterium]
KEIEAARQIVNQARSAFFPRIWAQADYKRNLTDRTQSTAVASLPGGGPLVYQDIDMNYDNELTLGIGVNQTIFDAGAIANYRQARGGQALREQSFEAVKQNLRIAAKKLYAQAQFVLTVAEIMEASEQTSAEIYQSIERKYRAGAATELELLMAEVSWKTKIPATSDARRNVMVVFNALHNLAGIPLSEEIVLTENISGVYEVPKFPPLEQILAVRPDYQVLLLSRELADINHRAALGSFLPVVSGGFSFGYAGMGNDSLTGGYDLNTAQLSLGVTIPLFTGGYRLARVKAARIEQEKASLSLVKKRGDIESALVEIELRISEAEERIELARLVETTARRALDLARSAYTNGLATQLADTEAANKLDEASLGLQSAIFEFRSASYDWELASGTIR